MLRPVRIGEGDTHKVVTLKEAIELKEMGATYQSLTPRKKRKIAEMV